MILQNIRRGVVGNVLINISPSNIFLTLPLSARYHQNWQAVLAAASINGLTLSMVRLFFSKHKNAKNL